MEKIKQQFHLETKGDLVPEEECKESSIMKDESMEMTELDIEKLEKGSGGVGPDCPHEHARKTGIITERRTEYGTHFALIQYYCPDCGWYFNVMHRF